MNGWMVRLKDGPFAGRTFGPVPGPPPEEMVLMDFSGEVAFAPYDAELMAEMADMGKPYRYRQIRASQLTDEEADNPHLVRGAEYEEVI